MGTRSSPPPFRRTKRGGGWSQPSRCPFFAGVCLLLLLPESAGSEGAGELRVPLSGKQGWGQAVGGVGGRQVEARSDQAPGPWPRGPQLEGAKAGATAWRTRIHTHSVSTPAYPFLLREGAPGIQWGRSSQGVEKEASPDPHSHRGRHLGSRASASKGQGRGVFAESHRGAH